MTLDNLKNIFRDALVYKPSADLISGQTETVTMLKNRITRQKLIDLIAICDKLKEMAIKNSNNSLLIMRMMIQLLILPNMHKPKKQPTRIFDY